MLERFVIAMERLATAIEIANEGNGFTEGVTGDVANPDGTGIVDKPKRTRKPKANAIDATTAPVINGGPAPVFTMGQTVGASTPNPYPTAAQAPQGIQAHMAAEQAKQQTAQQTAQVPMQTKAPLTAQDVAGIGQAPAAMAAPTYENYVRPAVAALVAEKGEPVLVTCMQRFGITNVKELAVGMWTPFVDYVTQVRQGMNPEASQVAAPKSLF